MKRHSTFFGMVLLALCAAVAQAQTASVGSTEKANTPLFKDYRGVKIGMSADEVRSRLNEIKKGDRHDYLVLSDQESAQIYYDSDGKVTAISIDYFDTGKAPSPDAVLGTAIQAKDDGSMYQLNRYPEAGYWVSYNRTAGAKPIVTITIQKM
jgi:hypothetical protein